MHARALLVVQFLVLLALGVTHISALQYSLYWHYVWLDTFTHFLGGAWVALVLVWLGVRSKITTSYAGIIAGVIVIGFGWEVFEYIGGIPREANFFLDTSIDLVMDVLGGIVGVAVGRKLS